MTEENSSGLRFSPKDFEGAKGKYGAFPEAGTPQDDLEFVLNTLTRQDLLVPGSSKMQFAGHHLPTGVGEMPQTEIEALLEFLKNDWNLLQTSRGRWDDVRVFIPRGELGKVMPDTFRQLQEDVDSLNSHGIPLALDLISIRRQIAIDGQFDSINSVPHIDPLSYLISISNNDSDIYTTDYLLGEGTMTPASPRIARVTFHDRKEFSSDASVIYRKPNFVAHISPPGPDGAERIVINVGTKMRNSGVPRRR